VFQICEIFVSFEEKGPVAHDTQIFLGFISIPIRDLYTLDPIYITTFLQEMYISNENHFTTYQFN